MAASPSAPLPSNCIEVDGIEGNATIQKNRNSSLRNGGSNIRVIVCFLDLSNSIYPIPCKTLGKTLFYNVCDSLNLIEVDYFGLMYFDSKNNQYWLDHEKPLTNQLELNGKNNVTMHFAVKFYTIEPSKLEDELTRYLFALQVKKDLADGSLICSENVTAMLCAFTVQAECGDYNSEYPNHFYISRLKLIPQQDAEFELKVFANHQKLIGLSPAEADMQLLELASSQEMYGIHLSPVKDHEGVPLNLAVIHHGILIFQNYTKVNTFDWAKIRKLSFKRKHLFIKLHHEEFFGDVLEFVFQHRNECKNFWKKCIEQHSFFKCCEVQSKSRQKLRIFSRGSSFRYAGRTQQQLSEFIKSNNILKQKAFQRSSSMKLNSAKEEDCAGHDSDYNGSRKENLDSNSCNNISSHQQIYKSCDTIDQESGLNYGEYYSLHSILSFADQSSSIANGKSNEYSLHATTNNGLMTGKLASYLKSGKSSKNALNNLRYFNRKDLCKIISHYAANDDSIPDMLFEYLQDFLMIKSYLISVSAKAKVQIDDDNEILFSNIDSFFH